MRKSIKKRFSLGVFMRDAETTFNWRAGCPFEEKPDDIGTQLGSCGMLRRADMAEASKKQKRNYQLLL